MSITSAPQGGLSGTLAANLICSASMLLWAAGLPAAQTLMPHVPPLLLAEGRQRQQQ